MALEVVTIIFLAGEFPIGSFLQFFNFRIELLLIYTCEYYSIVVDTINPSLFSFELLKLSSTFFVMKKT